MPRLWLLPILFSLAFGSAAAAGRPPGESPDEATAAATPGGVAPPGRCELSGADAAWAQKALDAWETARREVLALGPGPLPWIVLYDAGCVWHLAPGDEVPGAVPVAARLRAFGEPVPVLARPHDGTLALPNGTEMPARAAAFTSLWRDGEASFFVLAMADLWRRDHPETGENQELPAFFLGVAIHEMVHTLQLVEIGHRVEALGARYPLPQEVGDTVVEERFRHQPVFAEALQAERAGLLAAAAAPDLAGRRRLASGALCRVEARRERFLTGRDQGYAHLEDLLLATEGLAVWVHYRLSQLDPGVAFLPEEPARRGRSEVLERMTEPTQEWVQEAGFALVLLLDDLASDWRRRILPPELASPVALLEEALGWEAASCGPEHDRPQPAPTTSGERAPIE